MKNYLLLIGILLSNAYLFAQHETDSKAEEQEAETTHEEQEYKYKIAVAFGYSYIPAGFEEGEEEGESVFAPSIGLDFFYSIHPKFDLGIVADIELAEYLVDFNREDLNRERALILALIGAYEVLPYWELLFGGGVELEQEKDLWVVRLGTEYEIELGNGWDVAPSLFYDIKEEFSAWAFSVAIGKRF